MPGIAGLSAQRPQLAFLVGRSQDYAQSSDPVAEHVRPEAQTQRLIPIFTDGTQSKSIADIDRTSRLADSASKNYQCKNKKKKKLVTKTN